ELEFPPSPPLWHHLSRVAPDIIGRLKLGSTCFAAVERDVFLYSAHTNAVMTANDDGEAERLRRDWIIDALKFHGMCSDGHVIDTRRFMPDAVAPFGNGGDILYSGRCVTNLPPLPPITVEQKREEEVFEK